MTPRAAPRHRPGSSNGGRVTIDDVAREAGVSTATVSRVLNDARHVRAETRQRVAAVVERLNYRPSATAQSLATGRTLVIGVVVSDISIPFFTTVAHAIQNAAMRRNYLMLLGSSDERCDSEDDLVRAFAARMVDGLIVSPAVGENRLLREVVQTTPVVLVDRLVEGLDVDAVLSANREGVREATAYLLGLGHERIAYVTDRLDKTSTVERLAGYEDAMMAAGIEVDPALRWIVDYHPESAQRAVRRFLRRHNPTAPHRVRGQHQPRSIARCPGASPADPRGSVADRGRPARFGNRHDSTDHRGKPGRGRDRRDRRAAPDEKTGLRSQARHPSGRYRARPDHARASRVVLVPGTPGAGTRRWLTNFD